MGRLKDILLSIDYNVNEEAFFVATQTNSISSNFQQSCLHTAVPH